MKSEIVTIQILKSYHANLIVLSSQEGKDNQGWCVVLVTFSADALGFLASIVGFGFSPLGFWGFTCDVFCCACRLDGSRETLFI